MLIGVPLLFAVAIAGIIFPILGGIKASSGELWRYPVSIEFLKQERPAGSATSHG